MSEREPMRAEADAAGEDRAAADRLARLFRAAVTREREGSLEQAVAVYRALLALDPTRAPAHANLARILADRGECAPAEAHCRRALELDPDHADAHALLGRLLVERGEVGAGIERLRAAVRFDPLRPELHVLLGHALRAAGQDPGAETAFRRAVEVDPACGDASAALGTLLRETGRAAAARDVLAAGRTRAPAHAGVRAALGACLLELGEREAAEAELRAALALDVECAAAHRTLAALLLERGDGEGAEPHAARAAALDPDDAVAHELRGTALLAQGRPEEALESLGRAIRLRPGHAPVRWRRAQALLALGRFRDGLAEAEWRWPALAIPRREPGRPLWDGSPLEGRTILLHTAAGASAGETILLVRYTAQVAAAGGRVILECAAPMLRLLGSAEHYDALVLHGTNPLPGFDVHAPLESLPRLLGTRLDSIPGHVPYLHASADAPAVVDRVPDALNVGLVWVDDTAGDEPPGPDALDAEALAPLLEVRGVAFHSLQCGPAARQLRRLPSRLRARVADASLQLHDLADTARALADLDLLIAVDSPAAHVAGAIGRPGWVLLPRAPHWVWLTGRTDSPWYPTLRLVRHPPGGWPAAVLEVAAALAALSDRRASRAKVP